MPKRLTNQLLPPAKRRTRLLEELLADETSLVSLMPRDMLRAHLSRYFRNLHRPGPIAHRLFSVERVRMLFGKYTTLNLYLGTECQHFLAALRLRNECLVLTKHFEVHASFDVHKPVEARVGPDERAVILCENGQALLIVSDFRGSAAVRISCSYPFFNALSTYSCGRFMLSDDYHSVVISACGEWQHALTADFRLARCVSLSDGSVVGAVDNLLVEVTPSFTRGALINTIDSSPRFYGVKPPRIVAMAVASDDSVVLLDSIGNLTVLTDIGDIEHSFSLGVPPIDEDIEDGFEPWPSVVVDSCGRIVVCSERYAELVVFNPILKEHE